MTNTTTTTRPLTASDIAEQNDIVTYMDAMVADCERLISNAAGHPSTVSAWQSQARTERAIRAEALSVLHAEALRLDALR